jgi:predicted Zn-dependent protease
VIQALTRRQCCAQLAVMVGGVAVGGCLTVSPKQERELGQKEAEDVERTIGLVRDRRLAEYIGGIGRRLAQASGRTDITWQWNVADEAGANAFAVPGGWVYVTRGLLALMNREDELAGVIAHEMAHVTERHAVARVGAATPLAVLFGVPSSLLGMVSPSLGDAVIDAGRAVSGLALAPYSRDQELEADRLGTALAARAGWDPGALAEFLATLERAETLAGGRKRSSFFATHPGTPDRVANIQAAVRSLPAAAAPIRTTRAALLGRLDGLVLGDNVANGIFVGPLFLHPGLDLALEMPAGWKTANSPEVAGAVAPDETAAVMLQIAGSGDDPVAGARADGLKEEQIAKLRRLTIAHMPAATITAATRKGTNLAITWIAHNTRVVRVMGACGEADWERYRPEFERTTATGRPLRPEDRARIVETRLRLRTARAGERIAQVLARGGAAWSPAQAAVANAVGGEQTLERDWPVKVAVSEPYRP